MHIVGCGCSKISSNVIFLNASLLRSVIFGAQNGKLNRTRDILRQTHSKNVKSRENTVAAKLIETKCAGKKDEASEAKNQSQSIPQRSQNTPVLKFLTLLH